MFSEIEQDEIINKFLDTIEANNIILEYKNISKNSSSKFDNINIALKQSILPENVIDIIKRFNDDTVNGILEEVEPEPLEYEIDELKEETKNKSVE